MPLFAVSGCAARAGPSNVIRLPDFEIEPAQHTLLLGPSGAGKTTLLNLLAGLSPPLEGGVRFRGLALEGMKEAERDRWRGIHIGLIAQRLHLVGALDVFGNLALAMRLAGLPADRARADTLLEALDLAGMARRKPHELSQGEAQRVAIARAVIHQPAAILADEPTSALDDANCEAAMALMFERAAASGATLVVATHDRRIQARFAQTIALGRRT
jgi:putative ABC transport system ATP-binding protein